MEYVKKQKIQSFRYESRRNVLKKIEEYIKRKKKKNEPKEELYNESFEENSEISSKKFDDSDKYSKNFSSD